MKILVYDHGLALEGAIKLANDGHDVAYFTPWQKDFPEHGLIIGSGFPKVERVEKFTPALDRADMLVCFDTYSVDRAMQARRAGKRVWCAREAEEFELDRIKMKKFQEARGLPTQPWQVIKGIDALLRFLMNDKNKKVWIKSSGKHRGLIETFFHEDWERTRSQEGGQLMVDFGPVGNDIDFLVEDPVGDCEPGWDGFFAQGEHLEPAMIGYEDKDETYLGCVFDTTPEIFRRILKEMAPMLHENRASSMVSYEVRIDKKKDAYLIDPCFRAPHPPFACELEVFENFSDIITGHEDVPLYSHRYAAAIEVKSTWVESHHAQLEFDPKYRHLVKLSNAYMRDGKYWALPGTFNVGICVGLGDTAKGAVAMAQKVASSFKCKGMYYDEASLTNLLEKTVPEGIKYGVPFS